MVDWLNGGESWMEMEIKDCCCFSLKIVLLRLFSCSNPPPSYLPCPTLAWTGSRPPGSDPSSCTWHSRGHSIRGKIGGREVNKVNNLFFLLTLSLFLLLFPPPFSLLLPLPPLPSPPPLVSRPSPRCLLLTCHSTGTPPPPRTSTCRRPQGRRGSAARRQDPCLEGGREDGIKREREIDEKIDKLDG